MTRLILVLLILQIVLLAQPHGIERASAKPIEDETTEVLVESPITKYDRDHWAFRNIKRPVLPHVRSVSWPASPIDYFILAALEKHALEPSVPASRAALLRRLKLDIVGLPPTADELTAFEQDNSDDAVERIVDAFLASPAYGERWAQHWLDLARFAETDGFEHDKLRPDAFRYRQWVVDALNQDMPYDQFITSQIMGDLSSNGTDAIATMFCMAGPDMPDINEQDLRRHDKLNEITSTVAASLLGLPMHCAQCHDHKVDPISLGDFYRMRAIFDSALPAMQRDKPVVQLQEQTEHSVSRVYYRGELNQPGPIVVPLPPRIACSESTLQSFDSSQPRQSFCRWLFDSENTLVSRAIVNRVWQHHFGKSLCDNPNDFGLLAGEPSHPELLDWLAEELRQNEWSIKHLHRRILLSKTYQQAGASNTNKGTTTDGNTSAATYSLTSKWYGCFPRQRLEGETIRDAMLAISGKIDLTYGGPSVMPPLPDELLSTLLPGHWSQSATLSDHSRRSIYILARRNLRYPIFEAFDRPDAGSTCGRRDRSTTAIQSLHLLNSELALDTANTWALNTTRQATLRGHANDITWITEQLFMAALGRHPTTNEVAKISEYVNLDMDDSMQRWQLVCLALLNGNEFLYID